MFTTDESFSSDEEKEDASTHPSHSHFTACGKESSISYGLKRQERVYSEESSGPTLYEQSSSEGKQRKMLLDSDEKPKISCNCLKSVGNVTARQSINKHCKMTLSQRNIKSQQRTCAADECDAQVQSLDVKQSTSLPTEAEPHETKCSTPCQTVCETPLKMLYDIMHMFVENCLVFVCLFFFQL